MNMATTPPKPPEMIVFEMMCAKSGVPAVVEPPLKPIQPTHSRIAPMVASTALCPVIGSGLPFSSNRPMRGPMTMIAANATQPPTECTQDVYSSIALVSDAAGRTNQRVDTVRRTSEEVGRIAVELESAVGKLARKEAAQG